MQPGPVWVITGASRGIGAEFIEQVRVALAFGSIYQHKSHECVLILAVPQILANEQAVVIAGARSPESSKELQELHELHSERLHLVSLDVASTSSIQVCAIQTLRIGRRIHRNLDQPTLLPAFPQFACYTSFLPKLPYFCDSVVT